MQKTTNNYLHLNPSNKNSLPLAKNDTYMLYIHIPFCHTLCTYCTFHRFLFDEKKALEYFALLHKEMRMAKELGYKCHELYVGGGTTSIIPDLLAKTIDLSKELLGVGDVSVESDPNYLDNKTLDILASRVDRFSVGVQSFDDEILKKIGRYDKFGSGAIIKDRIENALGKIKTINIDMIFNFPGQDLESIKKDIGILNYLKPDQISYYPLMDSPSAVNNIKRKMGEFHTKQEEELYFYIKNNLKDYKMLSSWAFSNNIESKDEAFDEYVVRNHEYIGLGSGAFSFINGSLYVNTFSLDEYKQRLDSFKMSVKRERKYNKLIQMQYRLMLALFGGKLETKAFSNPFYLQIILFAELLILRVFGYVSKTDSTYNATKKGSYLFLRLMKEFYIGMDKVRRDSREEIRDEL